MTDDYGGNYVEYAASSAHLSLALKSPIARASPYTCQLLSYLTRIKGILSSDFFVTPYFTQRKVKTCNRFQEVFDMLKCGLWYSIH